MTVFDMLAFGLIGICIIISMMRGLIAEAASLLAWIIAFFVAKMFAVPFSAIAFGSFEPQAFSIALSFVTLFIAALFVQYLLRSLLTSAVKASGLGSVNRLLGGLFGAAKGIVLVTFAVTLCSFSDLPDTEGWRQSVSAGYFESLAQLAIPYLSSVVTEKLPYPSF